MDDIDIRLSCLGSPGFVDRRERRKEPRSSATFICFTHARGSGFEHFTVLPIRIRGLHLVIAKRGDKRGSDEMILNLKTFCAMYKQNGHNR